MNSPAHSGPESDKASFAGVQSIDGECCVSKSMDNLIRTPPAGCNLTCVNDSS